MKNRYYIGYFDPANEGVGGQDVLHNGPIGNWDDVIALQRWLRRQRDSPDLVVLGFSRYDDGAS